MTTSIDGKISSRLKSRRKDMNFSIQQLSKKSKVSTGQISQIEQGKVIPTVVCLYKLAHALEVDLNYFFEEEMPTIIQQEGERRVVVANGGNNLYEMLSPKGHEHLIDYTKITIKGHTVYEDSDNDVTHEGEECGYVLSGAMTVKLNGEEYVLHEGDSIYFSSKQPHHYENPFAEDCISIWAMTPLFF